VPLQHVGVPYAASRVPDAAVERDRAPPAFGNQLDKPGSPTAQPAGCGRSRPLPLGHLKYDPTGHGNLLSTVINTA
jgi:hypothetical protein